MNELGVTTIPVDNTSIGMTGMGWPYPDPWYWPYYEPAWRIPTYVYPTYVQPVITAPQATQPKCDKHCMCKREFVDNVEHHRCCMCSHRQAVEKEPTTGG